MPVAVAMSTLLCAVLAAAPDERVAEALVLELGRPASLVAPGSDIAPAPALLHLEQALPPTAGPGAMPGEEDRVRKLQGWGQALRLTTAASLIVTSTLGTMAAINNPTAFGDGRCITGSPVLGDYGCNRGLSTLHGVSAVVSVTLYTANGVLALSAPESRGTVSPGAKPAYRVLSWVHLTGIVLQPILGIVAAYPQVIGKSTTVTTDPLPRNLRTVHLFLGYITTAAFLTTTALEW
jgi:hypothetical protein